MDASRPAQRREVARRGRVPRDSARATRVETPSPDRLRFGLSRLHGKDQKTALVGQRANAASWQIRLRSGAWPSPASPQHTREDARCFQDKTKKVKHRVDIEEAPSTCLFPRRCATAQRSMRRVAERAHPSKLCWLGATHFGAERIRRRKVEARFDHPVVGRVGRRHTPGKKSHPS